MRPISPSSLALAFLVGLPWVTAVADDAPPTPPPVPKDAPEEAAPNPYRPHVIPGIRDVPHKLEDAWLARWLRQPGAYKARLAMPDFYVSTLDGRDLRAGRPPALPVPPPSPGSPEAPKDASLPPGIVPIGELPARIAAARAAGREQEAVELQAALDALKDEDAGVEGRTLIVRMGSRTILHAHHGSVDGRELPPGKYLVVVSEMRARRLQATGAVVSETASPATDSVGLGYMRFESIDAHGNRVISFVEPLDPNGMTVGGTLFVPRATEPARPGAARDANAPDGTAPVGPRPGLVAAIEDLRVEIRSLREEIRALRTALEGSQSPK